MPAFDDPQEELAHHEQMMGPHRGRLAVALDHLTNALVLVGQHGVYCHSHRDPAKPTREELEQSSPGELGGAVAARDWTNSFVRTNLFFYFKKGLVSRS